MNKCLIVAIFGTSFLSSVVVGSRIATKNTLERNRNGTARSGIHNPMHEEYSHPMGAELNAECQPSIPEEPCVTGSVLKKSFWGYGFCECVHGEKMVVHGVFARFPSGSDSCAAQRNGGSYFWISEASENVGCTCPGYGTRTCEPEVSVQVHTMMEKREDNFEKSNLKCMRNHVCKIDLGYFCTPAAGTQAQASESDCNYPHADCGPISRRCVARLAMIKEVHLSKEGSKENALPDVRQAVKNVAKISLSCVASPCEKGSHWSESCFDPEGWDEAMGSSCENAGLTEFCYP